MDDARAERAAPEGLRDLRTPAVPAPGAHPFAALQRAVGNRALARWGEDPDRLPPEMTGFVHNAVSLPSPRYRETSRRGRRADPEQPTGPLPFTATGWDGAEIARRMSQLNL